MNTGGVNPTNNRDVTSRAMAEARQAEMQRGMQAEANRQALREGVLGEGTSRRGLLVGGVVVLVVVIILVVLLVTGTI